MKITIEINVDENEMKEAVSTGWNQRIGDDEYEASDIKKIESKDDILSAFPFLSSECITIKEIRR